MKLTTVALATALLFASAAQASHHNKQPAGSEAPRPVGTGTGIDALRRTPCACMSLPNPAGLPEFLQKSIDAKSVVRQA